MCLVNKYNYKYDVYVSYAQEDNYVAPNSNIENGWVDQLIVTIKYFLQNKGKEINITSSGKLSNYGLEDDRIKETLNDSLILLPIISNNYLKSSSCKKERNFFREKFLNDQEYSDRIILVEKDRVDDNPFQEYRKNVFWKEKYTNGKNNVYTLLSKEHEEIYNNSIDSLKDSLIDMLKKFKNPDYKIITKNSKTIFLAEPNSDLFDDYQKIQKELKNNNHNVFPEKQLFSLYKNNPDKVKEKLSELLKKSDIFVQLIGDIFLKEDKVKEDKNWYEFCKMQHIISKELKIKKYLWLPPKLKNEINNFYSIKWLQSDNLSNLSRDDFVQEILKGIEKNENEEYKPLNIIEKNNCEGIILVHGDIPKEKIQKQVEYYRSTYQNNLSISKQLFEYGCIDSSRLFLINYKNMEDTDKIQIFSFNNNKINKII